LTNAHELSEPPATAIEDCVRARERCVPLRNPAQLLQLQFHCGKPPPAADPSTRIFTVVRRQRQQPLPPPWHHRWAMYMVISMPHRKSNAAGVSHFMTLLLSFLVESGQGAFDKAPSKDVTCAGSLGRRHLPQCRGRPKPDHHETDLMIFMSPLRAGAAGL